MRHNPVRSALNYKLPTTEPALLRLQKTIVVALTACGITALATAVFWLWQLTTVVHNVADVVRRHMPLAEAAQPLVWMMLLPVTFLLLVLVIALLRKQLEKARKELKVARAGAALDTPVDTAFA